MLQENGVPATATAANHLIERLPVDQRKRMVKRFEEVELDFGALTAMFSLMFENRT